MTTCHCDGPPHEYDPSWCIQPKFDAGTRAARTYGSDPWDNTPYDQARDIDYKNSIPRNHGGVGRPPVPPKPVSQARAEEIANEIQDLRSRVSTVSKDALDRRDKAEAKLQRLRSYLDEEAHWHEHGPFQVDGNEIRKILDD